MKKIQYRVEICFKRPLGNTLTCRCACPDGEWPSAYCSHLAGVLYTMEDFVSCGVNCTVSCISQLQQWNGPAKRDIGTVVASEIPVKVQSAGIHTCAYKTKAKGRVVQSLSHSLLHYKH